MRPWVVLFFVVVFASGAASGYFVGRSHAPPVVTKGEAPTRAEVLEAFVREVKLDAAQRAEFEKIFEANHQKFVSVKMRVEPELAALRSEVRTQLRAQLREDQRSLFEDYCNKRDRQRAENLK